MPHSRKLAFISAQRYIAAPFSLTRMANQNPEQLARDQIDRLLYAAGWVVQCFPQIHFSAIISGALHLALVGHLRQWRRVVIGP